MVTAVEYNPRYELLGCIARGTMASIHLARMTEGTGSSRIVVVKRLHREHTFDKNSVAILNEEARMWSSVRHVNVVGAVDLDVIDGVLGLVLEYVEGETLAELVARASERGEPLPLPVAISIVHGVLRGLKAIHEARGDDGAPLGIAHRGISPQAILVGTDGSARITDFEMAVARGKSEGFEGARREDARRNTAYMPPEEILGSPVDEKGDIYAVGVVLWELLTGARLPAGRGGATSAATLSGAADPPSAFRQDVPPELDAVVMRAIAPQAYRRFMTADAFAIALEPWCPAAERAVGEWVRGLAAERLASTRGLVHASGIPIATPTSGSEPSFPGVERPNGAELPKEGLFERTVRKILARTPFAPPANMQHFQWALLAGLASIVVLAYVFLGGMKSEPEATIEEPATAEPTLASHQPAPEPSPVTIATAVPEPVAPEPSTLPAPAPVAASAPVVDAPVRGSSIATPARAPTPKSDASPRPRPVRSAVAPASTAPSSPPPKAAADDPGALKDYR